MQLFFLGADVPLTKSFALAADGSIDKSAYPMVKDVTSFHETVNTAEQFLEALKNHAAQGHCLLKGRLNRHLRHESRAGATTALDATQWSCFDLDNLEDVGSVEQFIQQILPPAFHDVDHIIQYSASAGITSEAGIRAHVFFMHSREFVPEQAKLFITDLNLSNPTLAKQVQLSANGLALRFRLDRTVCQNDKLIYIAPPELGDGVVDRLGSERIVLVKGARSFVEFDWSASRNPQAIDAAVVAKVDELREAAGMGRKRARYRMRQNGEQILLNPDHAVVTGERIARGFVYLNLNGGDSWGYYYAEKNPRFLRNFKGEPIVVLADALPEYWQQIQHRRQGDASQRRPFAFRHMPTDTIWNGLYDPVNDRLEQIAQTTRQSIPDFFTQHNLAPPEVIEDWTFEFWPNVMKQVDFEKKFCNRWSPTEYMKVAADKSAKIPPVIDKVIRSVLANDEECYNHFLNWLAVIFQHRAKTMTAWVFSGIEGTGKGVLYHQILVPLFGQRYCVQKQMIGLEDRFNADLAQCLIYNFDEAKAETNQNARKAYDRLKNMITETTQEIRAMRSNPTQVDNYTNMIFTSNNYDAIGISASDRRFNVAPRQETKIDLTAAEVDAIRGELTQFAKFLNAYEANIDQARVALNNEAKEGMREAGQDWIDQMVTAVEEGNLEYFLQYTELTGDTSQIAVHSQYIEIIKRWAAAAGRSESVVTGAELHVAYMHLGGGNPMGTAKFGRFLAHRNLKLQPMWHAGEKKVLRGLKVVWKLSDEAREQYKHRLGTQQSAPGSVTIGPWNSDSPSVSSSTAP